MTETHFFTAEGALCGSAHAARLAIVSDTVTCSACLAALRQREAEEEQRPIAPPRVLARIRATG